MQPGSILCGLFDTNSLAIERNLCQARTDVPSMIGHLEPVVSWRKISLMLKNSARGRGSPLSGELFGFLLFELVCFLCAGHRRLRGHVEEPRQSFQILCHSRQVELFAHELNSA